MPSITFKVSDGQKYDFLWSLLNPNFNEEGGWAVEYGICEVYDDYAVVRNYAEGIFERVYYTKNDETDSLEVTNKERCYIVDVNEVEKNALTVLQTLNGGNYELVDEKFASIATLEYEKTELENQNSEYSTKVEELENTISTLTTERDEAQTSYENANALIIEAQNNYSELKYQLASVIVERDALASYKKEIEDNAKKTLITSYSEHLSAEVIDSYMNNLDAYTIKDLDMRLTYEVKQANPNLFTKNAGEAPAYVPKDNQFTSSLDDILSRYEKR